MVLCLPWIYFSYLAKREYVATIKRRFESRRLDLESARVSVQDAATLRFLEGVVAVTIRARPRMRSACWRMRRVMTRGRSFSKAAANPHPEVREQAYRIAAAQRYEGLTIEQPRTPAAIAYVLAFSPDATKIARELLNNPDPAIIGAALEALRDRRDLTDELVTREWLQRMVAVG